MVRRGDRVSDFEKRYSTEWAGLSQILGNKRENAKRRETGLSASAVNWCVGESSISIERLPVRNPLRNSL